MSHVSGNNAPAGSPWKHGRPKPVIGIMGGIGSGKSTIGRMFAGEGCAVIDSDALSHEILQTAEVKGELRQRFGEGPFNEDGSVSRRALANLVFKDAAASQQLNHLIHPKVARQRDLLMARYMGDGSVRAVIWDSPLLVETGLHRECDAMVFVKAKDAVRLERVKLGRGWDEAEVRRRENLQFSLDKKANLADYCIDNSGEQASSLRQVQQVLSHLLATSR